MQLIMVLLSFSSSSIKITNQNELVCNNQIILEEFQFKD